MTRPLPYPVNHTQTFRTVALALLVTMAITSPGVAQTKPKSGTTPAPERIDLICNEQPGREVVFGEAGQVSYEERAPQRTEPFSVSVLRTDPGAGFAVDAARIESDMPELVDQLATWTDATQVDAKQGRLRIDLNSKILTLVEADSAGQARFRRFECRDAVVE